MVDPRTNLKTVMDSISGVTKDDGSTAVSILTLWEGSNEDPHGPFIDEDYDIIVEIGEAQAVANTRLVQDIAYRRVAVYPVKAWCIDKYTSGSKVVTGALVSEKMRDALRDAVETYAQSSGFKLRNPNETTVVRKVSGTYVWETVYMLDYETSN